MKQRERKGLEKTNAYETRMTERECFRVRAQEGEREKAGRLKGTNEKDGAGRGKEEKRRPKRIESGTKRPRVWREKSIAVSRRTQPVQPSLCLSLSFFQSLLLSSTPSIYISPSHFRGRTETYASTRPPCLNLVHLLQRFPIVDSPMGSSFLNASARRTCP